MSMLRGFPEAAARDRQELGGFEAIAVISSNNSNKHINE